jgi:hypothetical protein
MPSEKQQIKRFADAGSRGHWPPCRPELYHRGGQAATGKVDLPKCVAIRSEQLRSGLLNLESRYRPIEFTT